LTKTVSPPVRRLRQRGDGMADFCHDDEGA
jgi:hypothetical protein